MSAILFIPFALKLLLKLLSHINFMFLGRLAVISSSFEALISHGLTHCVDVEMVFATFKNIPIDDMFCRDNTIPCTSPHHMTTVPYCISQGFFLFCIF